MYIPTQLLSSRGKIPTRANLTDAGYDLYNASEEVVNLRPGERRLFKTDIAIAIPEGYYGRIADRSGLALKQGVHVLGGVIDAGYRGNVGVILLNTNSGDETNSVEIKPGDRIAQLIIEQCHSVGFWQVESLDDTSRGQGGFGSSGK